MTTRIPETRRRLASTGLLLMLLTFVSSGFGQTFEPNTMRFDRLSVADGLAQSAVMAIEQDQSGFLWFATESGLDRYDGHTFRHYRHERGNPNALASDFVRDLALENDGNLWIATDGGGVSRWAPTTDTITTYRHVSSDTTSLATDRIRTILPSNDGQVWIGTRGAGLDRLNVATKEVTHFVSQADNSASLDNNDIYSLAIDASGVLWVGTKAGLNRLDRTTGQVTRININPSEDSGAPGVGARSLFFGHDGALWVGTNSAGVIRLNPTTGDKTYYGEGANGGLSSGRVEVIFEDDRQRLWAGTDKGLSLLDERSDAFVVYKNDPADAASLSGDSIFSIFQDRGGLLWFGTLTAGVNKWNPRSWSFGHFKPPTSGPQQFSSSNITAFTEDHNGNAWIGTFGGGINVIDRSGILVRHLRSDAAAGTSIGDDRVMALMTDHIGHIWAGTMTGGLAEIDPATNHVRVFRHDADNSSSLAANGVMSLLEDVSGKIWVGTFGGGVSRLDPESGEFTNFQQDPGDDTSLSSQRATAITQTRDGVVWVGTDGGGLNYLNHRTGEWHHLTHDPNDPESLSANTIYTLHVDPRGRLWVGTREGLDRVSAWPVSGNGARVLEASTANGLDLKAVYGIESDTLGNLWISSSQGLTSFNPDTGEVRKFHESQGLQGEEFNVGASYRGRDGSLYFGGVHGFNVFNPADLELNTIPPPVVLSYLSIINEPVISPQPYELLQSLDLDYSDHVVTFGVSILDYTAPEQNQLSYMLEGFDDDWVAVGSERRITYTNLDGGDYVLRVKAANSDGAWNEAGIELPMTVAFPPWKTWWAYLLYACAVMAAIFAFWRRQEEKLKRESEYSQRLAHEVQERTSELNNRNQDLKVANSKLQEASTTDALTGLRNRRFLFQQIGKDIDLVLRHYRDGTETMRPGGNNDLLFLMVDLDNFKPVNDKCGHEAGDRLLLQIRDVLLEACRKSDDVIRWGGDEFLIVARETNREYAATLAERVRHSLADRVFPVGDGQVARITSSIGYASYPFLKDRPDLLSWEEVLGVADAAMYEAKQNRNAWLGIEGIAWQGTGDELYRAVKTDPGQMAEDGVIQAIQSVKDAAEGYA